MKKIKKGSKKTVIILGMHRSGTSMTAGVLFSLGVSMGGRRLERTNLPGNPLGHYEDRGFVNLNTRILKEAGGSWQKPPDRAAILVLGKRFKNNIKRMLGRLRQPLAGWKDPRTSLTIELYLPYIKNPCFLVCRRQAEAVADSLYRRDKIPRRRGIRLHRIYEERIKSFFRLHPELPGLELDYQEVTADPEKWVKKIINFLGIRPERRRIERAAAFILPNEQAHQLAAELQQSSGKRAPFPP